MKGESIEDVNRRWRYRRRLTWAVMIIYTLVVLYGLFYQPLTSAYETILTSITSLVIAVVGSYIGFSTYDDVQTKKLSVSDSAMKPDVPPDEVG